MKVAAPSLNLRDSRNRVDPKALLLVKPVGVAALIWIALFHASFTAFADDAPPPLDIPPTSEQSPFQAPDTAPPPTETPPPPAAGSPATDPSNVPPPLPPVETTLSPPEATPPAPVPSSALSTSGEIETKNFDVTVSRRSNSMQVYALDYRGAPADLPAEGKVLLLKNASGPVLGALVLQSDAAKNQLIVKAEKNYPGIAALEPGQKLSGLIKVGDLPPAASITPQDKADVKEVTAPTPSPTETRPAPDTLTPPAPEPEPPLPEAKRERDHSPVDLEDAENDITAEDSPNLEKYSAWLTGEFSLIRNVDATRTSTSLYAAGGLRYGINLAKRVLFSKPHFQDSFTAEAGVFYYQIVNFTSQSPGDNYSIVPVIPTIRYNMTLSEDFTLFLYGGMMFNFVVGSTNPNAAVQASLGQSILAAGTGLFFRLGPNWHARVDLGYDMLGLGLVLRF